MPFYGTLFWVIVNAMPLLRVLLVDDNPTDRILAIEAFADYEPTVELTVCSSGGEALEYMHQHEGRLPDVLLLDINMPIMTGLELLKHMKQEPLLAHIPVVMLTTSGAIDDVRQAYRLQASSYLVKASSFSNFLAQIESFITYWKGNRFRDSPTA